MMLPVDAVPAVRSPQPILPAWSGPDGLLSLGRLSFSPGRGDLTGAIMRVRIPGARSGRGGRVQGPEAMIVCESLVRIYQTGSIEVQALQGLDLAVDSGEMIAVVGASGSGKSTLLSILAGVDVPTAGRARVDRWNLLAMSRADRVRYRRHTVGFVRQQTASNLVPYLTARQMVDLPMTVARTPVKARRDRAAELLATLGVADCADRRPS